MLPYVIGIDVGGTNLRLVAMDISGNLMKQQHYSSTCLQQSQTPVQDLIFIIQQFQTSLSGVLHGICAGFPGTVSKKKDWVYSCPNLPSFTNVNIATPLSNTFGVPVFAEHDVVLLMSYDLGFQNMDQVSTAIGIYLGTGLGNALWANGDFIYGANGVAGELSHIPTLGHNDPCPCGNRGCLELYTGGRQLRELAANHFPETSFPEIFTHHSNTTVITQYLDAVGTAIAIETNLFDPDFVILGGGVIHMQDFPIDKLKNNVLRYARKPFPHDNLRFVIASSEKFAGAIGACHQCLKLIKK